MFLSTNCDFGGTDIARKKSIAVDALQTCGGEGIYRIDGSESRATAILKDIFGIANGSLKVLPVHEP
jgi:hypothetical protein